MFSCSFVVRLFGEGKLENFTKQLFLDLTNLFRMITVFSCSFVVRLFGKGRKLENFTKQLFLDLLS